MGINLSKVDDAIRIRAYNMSRRPTTKKIDTSMIGNPTDFRFLTPISGSDTSQTDSAVNKSNQEDIKTSHISLNNNIPNKECALSTTWVEPTMDNETVKPKSSSEVLFKDALDARIIELINKKPNRTRTINGHLGSNKPRLMI